MVNQLKKLVFDTNALMDKPELLDLPAIEKIIPFVVLRELDNNKMSTNGEKSYKARLAQRKIKSMEQDIIFDPTDVNNKLENENNDDLIIKVAKKYDATLVTGDMLAGFKARSLGIDYFNNDNFKDDNYCGYKEVNLTDEEFAEIYEMRIINNYDLKTNEYLIVNHNDTKTALKWNGHKLVDIPTRTFDTSALGKFKPSDVYQNCVIDSLYSNEVTMIRGKSGSGKTSLALNYAISELEKGKIDRIVMFVGSHPLSGSAQIGYLPGNRIEKLAESGVGNILSSKLGSREEIYAMCITGKLELLPMSDIRGFEVGKNSILILTESQNTDKELMKTAMQRVAEGCKLIIDGDDRAQVDKAIFAGYNNGMKSASRTFRGEEIYGEMTLETVRRSRIASIADRM